MCRALTTRSCSKLPSRIWKTGFQYRPVLSMATWVQPAATNQSRRVRRAPVVVPKVRSVFVTSPGPTRRRRQAVMLPCAHPGRIRWRTGSPWRPPSHGRRWRGVHATSTLSRVLPLAGRHSSWCQQDRPGQTDMQAHGTKGKPTFAANAPGRRIRWEYPIFIRRGACRQSCRLICTLTPRRRPCPVLFLLPRFAMTASVMNILIFGVIQLLRPRGFSESPLPVGQKSCDPLLREWMLV